MVVIEYYSSFFFLTLKTILSHPLNTK